MISVHCVNMHRAFENVYKFVKTIAKLIQKIMARDHISSLYDYTLMLCYVATNCFHQQSFVG